MKIAQKYKQKKKEKLINLPITFKNNKLKSSQEIYQIINRIYQKERFEKVKLIKKSLLLFSDLIILLVISIIFIMNCQNKNSTITLKVSHNRYQKIFNIGIKPNEVWIDSIKLPNVSNSYNLNETNMVKLIWTENISNCQSM